jgi:hypothetical protein
MSSSYDSSSIENFISANKNSGAGSGAGSSAITTAITRSNRRNLKGGVLMSWLFYTGIGCVFVLVVFLLFRFFR